jgi:lipoprotein-anchoring transpeptidase ErfK/SrfK
MSPYGATDFDRRNYAALNQERFPLEAVELGRLDPKYRRQEVRYETREPAGTIVVDTPARYLYLVTGDGRALRYGIEVGREGFGWSGSATIARKSDWPKWTPPAEMVARDPRTAPYANGMPGGPENPLGARALYLYQNGRDTLYRIHGGGRPGSLGRATSSGCIRLLDHDVIDLYKRAPIGTRTVVLPDPVLSRAPTKPTTPQA